MLPDKKPTNRPRLLRVLRKCAFRRGGTLPRRCESIGSSEADELPTLLAERHAKLEAEVESPASPVQADDAFSICCRMLLPYY